MKSDTIGKLAEALSKAQGQMQNAAKDKQNPFFKSTYADLASVWDACRDPLSKNGLSVTQPIENTVEGIFLNTILMHNSGEWISSQIPIRPVKTDPQSLGASITYMRRFCLMSIVGVAPSDTSEDADDDGNKASGHEIRPIEPRWLPSEEDMKKLATLAEQMKWSKEQVKILAGKPFKNMNQKEFNELCKKLADKAIQEGVSQPKSSTPPWEESVQAMGDYSLVK